MVKTKDPTDYAERLSRVIAYIYDHLDDDIDLYKLAEIACLSPYHWHRVYHALHGETLAATVKRLRLHRAAAFLAHTPMTMEAIAMKSGYASPQAFTRAFSEVYGMPPAQYRKNGSHTKFDLNSKTSFPEVSMYNVRIENIPAMALAAIDHYGSYMMIGKAFEIVFSWFGVRNLIKADTRAIGIYYDDPASIAEENLRSKAGLVVPDSFHIEPPLTRAEITGGTYAVLRHQGPYADMRSAYNWLYGTWLVQSGYETADAPIFEDYLNNPREVAPQDLLTDIYLPLRLA
ncbi:MAG: AraC family transcriptional regulator [Alphaproteobacteria bacterium]